MASFGYRIKRLWIIFLGNFIKGIEEKMLPELAMHEIEKMQERINSGKEALIKVQSLVEKLKTQIESQKRNIKQLELNIQKYLNLNKREEAATLAVQRSKIIEDVARNEEQLKMQQELYENAVIKIKHALKNIQKQKDEITQKAAQMEVEKAIADTVQDLSKIPGLEGSNNFQDIVSRMDDNINKSRARVKVTTDLSAEGVDEIKAEEEAEKQMADQVLREFELEKGLVDPEVDVDKTVGPKAKTVTKS